MDMTEQLTLNTSGDFSMKTVFYEHIDFSDIFGLVFGCLLIVQEAVTKTIPKKKKCNKAKWLSVEALLILRKEEKQKTKKKRKDIPI